MCRVSSSCSVLPRKGGAPVSISQRMQPSEYRSDRPSKSVCSWHCSGLAVHRRAAETRRHRAQIGVRLTGRERARTRPKSIIFSLPRLRVGLRGARFPAACRAHNHEVGLASNRDAQIAPRGSPPVPAPFARPAGCASKSGRGRRGPEPIVQRFTRDKLHRIEWIRRILIQINDARDIGLMDSRGRARLAQEKRLRLLESPICEGLMTFSATSTTKLRIVRLVRHAHGPPPQLPKRPILAPAHFIMREAKRRSIRSITSDCPTKPPVGSTNFESKAEARSRASRARSCSRQGRRARCSRQRRRPTRAGTIVRCRGSWARGALLALDPRPSTLDSFSDCHPPAGS